jgi:hypothetical protein
MTGFQGQGFTYPWEDPLDFFSRPHILGTLRRKSMLHSSSRCSSVGIVPCAMEEVVASPPRVLVVGLGSGKSALVFPLLAWKTLHGVGEAVSGSGTGVGEGEARKHTCPKPGGSR